MIKTRVTGGTKSSQVTVKEKSALVMSGTPGNNFLEFGLDVKAQKEPEYYREG
jgi:hypothetical protein